jgi:hypothetical protein
MPMSLEHVSSSEWIHQPHAVYEQRGIVTQFVAADE